ncbi:hypothetical protein Ahy_A03g014914 [Arachis hypogaea]|uniref:Uncharacterized protein n=1 Tax=Arachis hypogaea TaxID=3818 RepID=A0A445DYY5_ARAHY|nr:hypothetical protein Ahy_A03g014914 [Arachis hypogaea]
MLVNHFVQLKFIWDAEHNLMIRKIYDHRATKHFKQMMSDVCKGHDHLTSWIRPAIKKEVEVYFTHDEGFKRRRLTNIANRVSPRLSKYMGGSATFMKRKSKLYKSLDREATLAETFKYTHTLKDNKERFADERGLHAEVRGHDLAISAASGNDEVDSETSMVDPDRLWCEIVSQPHKNIPASGWDRFLLVASAPPCWGFLCLCLYHQSCQFPGSCRLEGGGAEAGSEQRYNDLLTRVGGAVAISSDLTEKMEQLERL